MRRIVFVVLACIVTMSFSSCGYNTMVSKDENVKAKWAQVENTYQRRADLIPNLVNTVKGSASHESETLEAVVNARAKATQVTVDPSNLSEESIEAFQQSQDALSQSIGRLLVSVEAYPDLKANENFRDLQAQLEGTENRITVERRAYNEAVQDYNTTVRSFPKNIMASIFGFKTKGTFKASEGADRAPEVSF
ncbi:MAG TPA: LemA family protein [Candidatus Sphingobacterium stercoripullorum]|uniref:LemA family protein n=1 Tax=Candidatus Sphingobacterium stercoripullorum TaxID=2838759 RepID=A0A9D1W6N3_9SPHI|nr:LemA family protein [Candidatus Sphingobacterium stercoripullorum]HLR50265.1 LemA family protein [Candidatus Sphingobacterium stercoripullorum]